MAAHTAAAGFTETTYAISATLPATYDAAGYGATTITYTEIGKVQDFPEYGIERAFNEFTPIKGATEYIKGGAKYNGGPLVVADVPADAGQVILKAAAESANTHYSIKVTYPDGEIHYMDAQVGSWKLSGAKEGSVMTRTAELKFCKAPVIVAAV